MSVFEIRTLLAEGDAPYWMICEAKRVSEVNREPHFNPTAKKRTDGNLQRDLTNKKIKMANILGIQILGVLFSVFMMYFTFLHYKRKEFTIREFSFWIVFWIGFVGITIFPQVLDPILTTLNIGRTLDFFIIAGFLFLIFVSVYTYTIVRKNQRKLEELVRNLAMKKK